MFIKFFIINSKSYSNNEAFKNETKFKRSINLIDNNINDISELNKSIINIRSKRKIVIDKRLRWGLTIFYYTEEPINPFMIAGALKTIEQETCLRFIPLKKLIPNVSGLHYKYVGECLSDVGRTRMKQWQIIKVGRMCDFPGGIIHETFHALGLIHEQCRYNRDLYINVIENNLNDGGKLNCQMFNRNIVTDYYQPYDYGSIMHYGLYVFSINGGKTLVPRLPHYESTIGNFETPTFLDYKTINVHYCTKICIKKILCFNDGYQDPNNCNTCKCVEGYGGNNCNVFAKTTRACGKTEIILGGRKSFLNLKGRKNCIYHLLSARNRLIELLIANLEILPNLEFTCSFKNTLEVKYLRNKATTGARFCIVLRNIHIKSHTSHVIIYYKSVDPRNYAFVYFKESTGEK
uniref:Metalloendopeptidase n=1 Tax=Strongyloides stercoralis TaxID=6248 RepID=A0AAF5I0M6_STRER